MSNIDVVKINVVNLFYLYGRSFFSSPRLVNDHFCSLDVTENKD